MSSSTNRSVSFHDTAIVACGTMQPELRALAAEGFLDGAALLFTAPGLHEWPWELEAQLDRQLRKAKDHADRVIVAYGERCFLDTADPTRDTDALVRQHGPACRRIRATNCVDMLADEHERRRIAAGQRVYWLTPGWLAHWNFIFKDWDVGQANETFPAHDKAVVLDALGYFDKLSTDSPERLLEISDWMKLPIEPAIVSLDRLKRLLADQLVPVTAHEGT